MRSAKTIYQRDMGHSVNTVLLRSLRQVTHHKRPDETKNRTLSCVTKAFWRALRALRVTFRAKTYQKQQFRVTLTNDEPAIFGHVSQGLTKRS